MRCITPDASQQLLRRSLPQTEPVVQRFATSETALLIGVEIDGANVRPYVVGDAGYKLEAFLMIPYGTDELRDPVKKRFKLYQSSTWIIVEQALGMLKGRSGWLNGKVTCHNPLSHAAIIGVGCILHNLMMDSDLQFDADWAEGVRLRSSHKIRPEKDHSLTAVGVRNKPAEYVCRRHRS